MVALHDCNEDVNRAINFLLESTTDTVSVCARILIRARQLSTQVVCYNKKSFVRTLGRRWGRSAAWVRKEGHWRPRRRGRRKEERGKPAVDEGGPTGEAEGSVELVKVRRAVCKKYYFPKHPCMSWRRSQNSFGKKLFFKVWSVFTRFILFNSRSARGEWIWDDSWREGWRPRT